jgi:hypothetical protein
MSRAIEQFTQKSHAQRFAAFAVLVASLGLVTVAERDIQHRPAERIHGSKLRWRLICLNALGAVGYLRWGRRTTR